ncbi:MAG TPA: cytochrome P450 [Spongiibacteraceae bacterium]|nr:cytochrome P450 [Spongiibacteraceae bacterium]
MYGHLISPLPPIAGEELPHIGAGLRFLEAPTAYLQELRARHGDTYLLDLFGFNLLMTFAPKGLENLYKLEEEQASFGLATYDMIGFKTPGEIFQDADIGLFYQLLLNKRMPGYVATINDLVDTELQRWQGFDRIDIFDAVRTLEQRVGYGLWIAKEAAADAYWPDLKRHFDVIGQESAFVNPQQTLETIKSNKAREKAAVADIKELLKQIIDEHDNNPHKEYAAADFLREHFSAASPDDRARKLAHNIINTNQGFLSNLYAAIAWVIVRLLQHADVLAQVKAEIATVRAQYGENFYSSVEALNALIILEQVMMESVRLAQRSLTLRKVVTPVEFNDGQQKYTVQPGVYIATMLSVTNIQSDELARFDPAHFQKNQIVNALAAAGKETISTFGHGKHACPAQKFSHHMCKIVVSKILANFDLVAEFNDPQPSARQMGGVSRPDEAVIVRLKAR